MNSRPEPDTALQADISRLIEQMQRTEAAQQALLVAHRHMLRRSRLQVLGLLILGLFAIYPAATARSVGGNGLDQGRSGRMAPWMPFAP